MSLVFRVRTSPPGRRPSLCSRLALAGIAQLALNGCVDRKAALDHESHDAGQTEDLGRPNDASPTEDAGPGWSDGALPPLTSTCSNQRGMVGIPFPDGTCYLMDPWPVTRGEYYAALAEGPLESTDPSCADEMPAVGPREETGADVGRPGIYCYLSVAGNESTGNFVEYDRRMPWPPAETEVGEPMVCVSWCDAEAYCTRQNKRLCGNRLMNRESEYDPALIENAEHDEMYNVCTGGGTRLSPSGARVPALGVNQVGNNEYVPLSHAQLADGGEGAFKGVYGIRVGGEFSGPLHDTIWTDFPSENGGLNVNRECHVNSAYLWRLSWQDGVRSRFSGTATFRCCADPEL